MPLDRRVRALLAAGQHAEASTAAIRELGPQVLRYVRAMVRAPADAEDAFARWAECLWAGLPDYRGDASLRTWALRLAHNAALELLGGAHRRRTRPLLTGEASRLAVSIRTKSVVRVDRQRRRLDDLLGALTPGERTLILLRIDQGLDWEEIAQVLSTGEDQVSPKTAAKRFERLKGRLAAALRSEQGPDDPAGA
jgi:RNA polymerase sigma-70 factor (ECF subfamily)